MDFKQDIKDYIACEIEVLQKIDVDAINTVLNLLEKTRRNKKRIYVFGNGGSAATASHMQNDFNKGVSEWIETKFRFHCLNDNVATMMAIANDIGYDDIFRFQLDGQLEPGDLIMAISGSGNSKNVIKAVEYAKSCGNKVIGVTGYNGGRLKEMSDCYLHVPIDSMQITEDVHMIFDHLMMSVFYKYLCGREHLS
ncbi:D-sedoheptulose-7-phosphate isomerase [Aminipila luticellarii]|uniref:SIS domain-containing protein n=1 Tax=Aminipila luticellarii TaxID=2507160 RepID=A0A410PSN7_9FIRM|nr:SIS domain-containing protein [Aminipila luticellarii]QAT41915.1 SIS domain-containing protein [Aminipila luticellarii]